MAQKCPNPKCNSEQVIKAGFRITREGKKQKMQCQICGKIFYESQTNSDKEMKLWKE